MKLFVECVSLLEKPGNTENVASLLTHFSKPLLSQYLKWLNGTHDWFEGNPHLDACKRVVEEALK